MCKLIVGSFRFQEKSVDLPKRCPLIRSFALGPGCVGGGPAAGPVPAADGGPRVLRASVNWPVLGSPFVWAGGGEAPAAGQAPPFRSEQSWPALFDESRCFKKMGY